MIQKLSLLLLAFLFVCFNLHSEHIVYHTVRRGENLSLIAKRYNTTPSGIQRLNNLRSSVIHPNQRLIVRRISSGQRAAHTWGYDTITYVVQRGDNLWNISRKFNTSVAEIRRLNNLRGDNITAGSRLRINVPRTLPDIEAPEPITSTSSRVYYRVKRGDTIEQVATKYGITPEILLHANLLSESDFKEGQVLVIPSASSLSDSAASDSDIPKEISWRESVVNDAFSYLGMPYKLGGAGNSSIDCSTLTRLVYRNIGVLISNTSILQFNEGVAIALTEVSPGDLVFFNRGGRVGHVGVYIGSNLFIHASSARKEVTVASLENPYFRRNFAGARRYLPSERGLLARRFDDAFIK